MARQTPARRRAPLKDSGFILSVVIALHAISLLLPGHAHAAKRRAARPKAAPAPVVAVSVPVGLLVSETPLTDDSYSRYQWGLRVMLDGARYGEVQGDAPRDVVVAVIDRGVQMNHPDLVNKVRGGWNFIDGKAKLRVNHDSRPPAVSVAHGQCAASLIAAEVDNKLGIAGIFRRAYIMPLQSDGQLAEAIDYAVDHDADVIVVSGGAGPNSDWLWPLFANATVRPSELAYSEARVERMRAIKRALGRAYDSKIPVLTGVGNTRRFALSFIADDPRTITVAPHTVFGTVSLHRSFGYSIEVFAPGGSRLEIENLSEVEKAFPDELPARTVEGDYDDPLCAIGPEGYSFFTLSSAALPHAAGAVAMIKSYLPESTVDEVRQILREGSVPLKPDGSLLEGLGGRISLRLMRAAIDRRLQKAPTPVAEKP
jgi:subtilisin family serine protease